MVYKYFPLFWGGLFILLVVSFVVQKLFGLIKSHLLTFAFVVCASGVIVKNLFPRPMPRSLLLMLSSRSFTVSGITFKVLFFFFNLFWVDFGKWCEIAVQLNYFRCEYPVFQHHLLERLSFLHWVFLTPLSNISRPYMHGFISWLSVLFRWSMCLFLWQCILFWLLQLYNIV